MLERLILFSRQRFIESKQKKRRIERIPGEIPPNFFVTISRQKKIR